MINKVVRKIKNNVKLLMFKKKWRKKNSHNNTNVKKIFPIDKVVVGEKTYGSIDVNTFGNPEEKLIIGSYCSIAGDVKFLLGGEHPYQFLSTFPFKKYIYGSKENTLTKGPIVLKDDVWIGERCLILSGVTIGQGAIIAAGSVVAKDVPPYAIFAGGKILKYRFSENIIEKLLEIDFSKLSEKAICDNIELLYKDINIDMLENDIFKKIME
ncbi:CatB-related O-acetyltransferase [Bacillus alkalisoli]|uniref:CatB-related O-acetyltransferase n=1 Tax=Bacillus alkalisoli TaxID=2011008 RepID=UPI000C23BA00|nr:CatB-related O-acetyltransferase [Bacillus alkalisoli]